MSSLFSCPTHGRIAIDVAGQPLLRAYCPICKRAMLRSSDPQRIMIVPEDTARRIAAAAEVQGVRQGQIVDAFTFDIGEL